MRLPRESRAVGRLGFMASADNGEFKSDLFGQGKTFSFTFSKAGTYPHSCTVHAGMTGTIIVE